MHASLVWSSEEIGAPTSSAPLKQLTSSFSDSSTGIDENVASSIPRCVFSRDLSLHRWRLEYRPIEFIAFVKKTYLRGVGIGKLDIARLQLQTSLAVASGE